MNKENLKLNEQEAPEKNGDGAFIQVGTDGKAVVPQEEDKNAPAKSDTPKQGTLADR